MPELDWGHPPEELGEVDHPLDIVYCTTAGVSPYPCSPAGKADADVISCLW